MRRGELYRVRDPSGDPKSHRVFVVVSRPALIDSRYPALICAPVHSDGGALPTEVRVGIEYGLKHTSWIACDQLTSLPRVKLTDYVGAVRGDKLAELNRALRVALDLV